MKKPKAPKKTRPPKKPKQSASVKVWENYDKRYKDWQKKEADKQRDYKCRISGIESAKKKKESLIKKYS